LTDQQIGSHINTQALQTSRPGLSFAYNFQISSTQSQTPNRQGQSSVAIICSYFHG